MNLSALSVSLRSSSEGPAEESVPGTASVAADGISAGSRLRSVSLKAWSSCSRSLYKSVRSDLGGRCSGRGRTSTSSPSAFKRLAASKLPSSPVGSRSYIIDTL